MVVARGYYKQIIEFQGSTPAIFGQKGESFNPSCAAVPLAPTTCPKKKSKYGRARHGLRTPCQRFIIEFGAGWGTWERLPRAHFTYTPKWPKGRGVYPPRMIISIKYYTMFGGISRKSIVVNTIQAKVIFSPNSFHACAVPQNASAVSSKRVCTRMHI